MNQPIILVFYNATLPGLTYSLHAAYIDRTDLTSTRQGIAYDTSLSRQRKRALDNQIRQADLVVAPFNFPNLRYLKNRNTTLTYSFGLAPQPHLNLANAAKPTTPFLHQLIEQHLPEKVELLTLQKPQIQEPFPSTA